MFLLNLLVTLLNRNGEVTSEKKPWEKDNSWLVKTSILPEMKVSQVYYKDRYEAENLTTGITDISFVVTKV